jgi:HEAT repeat protein
MNISIPDTSRTVLNGKRLPGSLCQLAAYALAAALFLALPSFAAEKSSSEQVQKLTRVLQSSAAQKEKADACRELARIADQEAIVALAALLPDESLSHMARYALETIPSPEVDKVLRAAVFKLHGRPLVGVIGSLGVRRDPKAVKPLSNLLTDSDPDVAQAAARALGNIGNSAAAKALQKALSGAPAVSQLAFCEGLLRCAERLGATGSQKNAVAIYDSLRHSQAGHQVRTAALRGAILARQSKGVPLLVESLGSADYAVFATAVRTSLEVPGQAVTSALAAELAKPSADRQTLIASTLAKRHDPAGLPALVNAAKTGAQPVSLAAIRALGEMQDPAALPALLELMKSTEREVALTALEAMAALPGREVDEAVLAMLRGDEKVRTTGMDLVVRRRMSSALPELFKAASSQDTKLRVTAVRKIAELADASQIPGMLALLSKASTPEDLEATEQALGSIALKAPNRDTSVQPLAAAMATAAAPQKCALARILSGLGGATALKAVRAAVNDPDPEVRTAAIRALGDWSSAEAAPDLLELARNAADPKDKLLSLRSYLGLASQSELTPEARLAMCREAASLVQSPEETKLLLAALGGIRSPDSLALILPHLEATSSREEASAACLGVAAKLLEGNDASKNVPVVIETLRKVVSTNPDSEAAKKAQALIEKAQGLGR